MFYLRLTRFSVSFRLMSLRLGERGKGTRLPELSAGQLRNVSVRRKIKSGENSFLILLVG